MVIYKKKIDTDTEEVKIKEEEELNSNKDEKQASKNPYYISELLPYLDNKELHEIVQSFITEKENSPYKDLDLQEFYDYLANDDLDYLFVTYLEHKDKRIDIHELVSYLSSRTLTVFVDEYMMGKYQDIDINILYPYMKSADIKRLLNYYLAKKGIS